MRRFAFTLSEILITLAIVGVVAVLTVPNVTKNAYKRTNIVRLETTIKTLNDAVKNMMVNEHQTSIWDTTIYDNIPGFYSKYLKTSKVCKEVNDCFASSYKSIDGDAVTDVLPHTGIANASVILPSGVSVYYAMGSVFNSAGHFVIDVNGKEGPNIVGRDIFTVEVSDNGFVGVEMAETDDDLLSICLSGIDGYGAACVQHLQKNNWVMDY